MPLEGTQIWRLHTNPYIFEQNVFPKISHMNYAKDLILGESFCTFIFFHFLDSELSVLHWFAFLFLIV